MKPLKIYIERHGGCREDIRYVFRTIASIIGLPYHFVKIRNSADIIYSPDMRPDDRCKVFIKADQSKNFERLSGLSFIESGGMIFLESDKNKEGIVLYKDRTLVIDNDIIHASYIFLTGKYECLLGKEASGFLKVKNTFLSNQNISHKPLINLYAEFLKKHINSDFEFAPMWPDKKKYAVCLTHDVDYPEIIRIIEALRFPIKSLKDFKSIIHILKDPQLFWRFEDWMDFESKKGFKSSFCFCCEKGSLPEYIFGRPDPFYEIKSDKFKKVIDSIIKNGCDIFLHTSYNAYKSLEKLCEEKRILESITGSKVLGNRHHYFHLNPKDPLETLSFHEKAGFLFDMSISFETLTGFRRGISTPFYPYDYNRKKEIKTLQLPTSLMDSQLYQYLDNHRFWDRNECIHSLLYNIKKTGGILVTDYHERACDPVIFKDWFDSYIRIIEEVRSDNCYFTGTASEIYAYFDKRQKMLDGYSIDETSDHN